MGDKVEQDIACQRLRGRKKPPQASIQSTCEQDGTAEATWDDGVDHLEGEAI